MTAREIVSVLGKLAPDTQRALSDRAVQRDPRFLFICDLVDEVQSKLIPMTTARQAPRQYHDHP